MATASASCCSTIRFCCSPPTTTRLHLFSPVPHARLSSSAATRLASKARASFGPPPPPLPLFETEEEVEEEEEEDPEWSGSETESGDDEREWEVGGDGAPRGEEEQEEGGDLSGWARRSPRPRELFVCNLPRRCGDDDLLELFRPHGTVLSVEIKRDSETGMSRGCALVTMRSLIEARAAVDALDGFDMDGREVFVKLASHVISNRKNVKLAPHTTPTKDHIFESAHKVYVGNLAWSVQPQDLRELFTQCGTVVSTRLLSDRKGGSSRVYGFLSFSSAQELQAALKLDRTVFHGRDIIIKEAHVER